MDPVGLEQLLENPDDAPFYDLLGGLSDNLLTIGGYAGTFLSCDGCGTTFSTKDWSWKCEKCDEKHEIKFTPAKQEGSSFKSRVTVSGLSKAGWTDHWYYENENWSVAEFLTQILRLRPEDFLGPWFQNLGVEIESPILETVLCWPRFRFGGKTIQPDLAVGFERDIVLIEFKRPKGGRTPPVEVMAQLCFAAQAGRQLGRRWHIVLVPGRNSSVRTSADYVRDAVTAVSKAQIRWAIPSETIALIQSTPAIELESHVRVLGWESLLRLTSETILATVPDSWTRKQALAKLRFFQTSRAERKLLSDLVSA